MFVNAIKHWLMRRRRYHLRNRAIIRRLGEINHWAAWDAGARISLPNSGESTFRRYADWLGKMKDRKLVATAAVNKDSRYGLIPVFTARLTLRASLQTLF